MNSDQDFYPNEKEYTKCAPSKTYTDGSCFTIKSLQKIANAHNRFVGNRSNKLIKIDVTEVIHFV